MNMRKCIILTNDSHNQLKFLPFIYFFHMLIKNVLIYVLFSFHNTSLLEQSEHIYFTSLHFSCWAVITYGIKIIHQLQ